MGVTVIGYQTRQFPGFYLADSGFPIDWCFIGAPEEAGVFLPRLGRKLAACETVGDEKRGFAGRIALHCAADTVEVGAVLEREAHGDRGVAYDRVKRAVGMRSVHENLAEAPVLILTCGHCEAGAGVLE